jgi:hypothetical protein
MTEPQQACATDKEIFDVLMGAKKRFTDSSLLEIARGRGIFYSGRDERESLASNISLLPHGLRNLTGLLEQREPVSRAERVTHISLPQALDIERIKEIALQYQADAQPGEEVECVPQGTYGYTVSVRYSEIDYSKTRLIQRREKEADIEFVIENGQTTIRMPANDKAASIASDLKDRLDHGLPTKIPATSIDLSDLIDPQQRSEFFTLLISSMPGLRLWTVTSLKVQKKLGDDEPNDLENEHEHAAEEREMLGVVESVALRGQALHTSPEYQEFRERGFYIASIIWRSEQDSPPHYLIEFEAGFEDPETCKVFRYKLRGVYHKHKDKHAKTLKAPEPSDRVLWLGLIESTSHVALKRVRETVDGDGE